MVASATGGEFQGYVTYGVRHIVDTFELKNRDMECSWFIPNAPSRKSMQHAIREDPVCMVAGDAFKIMVGLSFNTVRDNSVCLLHIPPVKGIENS